MLESLADHQTECEEMVTINSMNFVKKWSAEEIANDQRDDPDMAVLYKAKSEKAPKPKSDQTSGLSEAAKGYLLDWARIVKKSNGILYRIWESEDGTEVRHQILLPHKYRARLFQYIHKDIEAAHMGRRKTLNKLKRKFHWHRAGEDIKWWIRNCVTCQKRKRPGKTPKAPLQIYLSGEPNERIAMDIVGPFVESERGNVCILVIVDHFTKYAKAVALPDMTSASILDAIMNGWVSIFGAPTLLHSDRGTNMESHQIHEFCRLLSIKKTKTAAYHPECDGQAERQIQTLMTLVHTYAANDPTNWDKYLDIVLMGYNSTIHAATGIEPNRMMFGRNIDMPVDLMTPRDPDVEPLPVDQYVLEMDERIRKIYTVAREHLLRAATANKRYHDKNVHVNHYKTGDPVWIKNPFQKAGQKFGHKYIGPYYIIRELGVSTFSISQGEGLPTKVRHHNSLVPCYDEHTLGEADKGWIYQAARQHKYLTGQIEDTGVQTARKQNGSTSNTDGRLETINEETEPAPDAVTTPGSRVMTTSDIPTIHTTPSRGFYPDDSTWETPVMSTKKNVPIVYKPKNAKTDSFRTIKSHQTDKAPRNESPKPQRHKKRGRPPKLKELRVSLTRLSKNDPALSDLMSKKTGEPIRTLCDEEKGAKTSNSVSTSHHAFIFKKNKQD